MATFKVEPYSTERLTDLLVRSSRADRFTVSKKAHITYFDTYFAKLEAKTILVERRYIDQDFTHDFVSYYVLCFKRYRRTCVRLHFFSIEFTEERFAECLCQEGQPLASALQDAYLGFIVVKPLPDTIIGRTCLKTYPHEDTRFFPISRRYQVHLFGIPLHVDTLAFQEQDQVTAACATSALWSVFHGTGILFHHTIPSPVEITKVATSVSALDTRILPETHGLTDEQMAHAIRSVSLEPYLVNVVDEYICKTTLYAYLRAGVPVLLGIDMVEQVASAGGAQESVDEATGEVVAAGVTHVSRGGHAVAATGYNLGLDRPQPYDANGFLLRASRIDKIFAHDDQVGPFSRMKFDGERVRLDTEGPELFSLSTSFGMIGEDAIYRALPEVLIIPLYPMIRIPFELIHEMVLFFDAFVEDLRASLEKSGKIVTPHRLEWDIYLTTVNDLKRDVRRIERLHHDYRLKILTESWPRFIWRATGYSGDTAVLDLLFDATDIEQGTLLLRAIEYHDGFSVMLRHTDGDHLDEEWFRETGCWQIINWFRRHAAPPKRDASTVGRQSAR